MENAQNHCQVTDELHERYINVMHSAVEKYPFPALYQYFTKR
jgi:hypothetical protein